MRHGTEGRSAVPHGFVAPLVLALLAGLAAVPAACGGSTTHDLSIDDSGAATLAAQVGSLDDTGWQLDLIATRAAAVQEAIAGLAKSNRAAMETWKAEWEELQSAHAAAVAEVEQYNATVARPAMVAAVMHFDPETGTTSFTYVPKEEAVPAKPLPAAPQPPPAVSVDLDPVLSQLDGLEVLLRRLEAELRRTEAEPAPSARPDAMTATSLTFIAVTDTERLLVVTSARRALATAADELDGLLTDIRRALRKGVASDPPVGDVCAKALTRLDFSAARAIGDARAALRVAGAENGVAAADISWASSLPTD